MPEHLDLGEWIRSAFGDQGGLAAKLRPKVAKNTVSSWKTGRNRIPPDYQKQIRAMGYTGPWPAQEAQDTPAPAAAPLATAADVAELRGALRAHVEQWERGQEKVLQLLVALDQKIAQLSGGEP